jgi:hypothetical protein
MRRRGGPDSSSLEMLLDTICNTFGGVLFLAMLVSIMLAQTRKRTEAEAREEEPRPAVSAADLVRLESDAARLALEIEALEEANAAIRSLAEGFDDPRQEELLAAMEQAERDRTRQESKRATLLRDLAAAQAASAKARAAAAAQNREAGHMADRVNAARDRLEQAVEERRKLMESASVLAIAERERSAFQTGGRAPRERKTDRNEFGVMLKYGRLYLMKVLQNGELVVNSTDFAVEGGTTTNKATAKPHAGIDLKRGEGRDRAIEAALDAFPPKRWYPCLVVHPDSFEEFLVLKSVLVSRGYDYRLLPTAGSVFDGQNADARVQ